MNNERQLCVVPFVSLLLNFSMETTVVDEVKNLRCFQQKFKTIIS